VGKHVRVYLKEGADRSGVFKANLKDQQRFLLKERGGVDQVISYHNAVRVVDLESKKGWPVKPACSGLDAVQRAQSPK
jgi:hypothetical protein